MYDEECRKHQEELKKIEDEIASFSKKKVEGQVEEYV